MDVDDNGYTTAAEFRNALQDLFPKVDEQEAIQLLLDIRAISDLAQQRHHTKGRSIVDHFLERTQAEEISGQEEQRMCASDGSDVFIDNHHFAAWLTDMEQKLFSGETEDRGVSAFEAQAPRYVTLATSSSQPGTRP